LLKVLELVDLTEALDSLAEDSLVVTVVLAAQAVPRELL
jgi:hypothetical protein